MSGWKTAFKKGSAATLILAVVAALVITAIGALSITVGIWPVDRMWIWISISWCSIGYICCRYTEGEALSRILQTAMRGGIVVAIVWLLGFAVAKGEGSHTANLARYVICALSGVAAALIFPHRSKRRKRHKKHRSA